MAERERTTELEVILRGITDGITALDPSGRMLYANDAAARAIGVATAEELLAMPVARIVERFEIFDEQGKPISMADLPGREALAGHEVEKTIGFRVVGTGELRWSVVRAMPVLDDVGRVALAINVFRDITERRTALADVEAARKRLAFLYRATQALDEGPLDRGARVGRLVELVVPELGDWCAVFRCADGGPLALETSAGADETELALAGAVAAELERSGRSQLGERESRWYCAVPLEVRGRLDGAIAFGSRTGRRYGPDDLAVSEELGDRAAQALETARLYEESQSAVRAREDLMAFVSHDLRNPLSAVVMAAELLQRTAADEPTGSVRKSALIIARSVERMERLIGDLLDLARIEAGGLSVELRQFDAAALVAEAIDLHGELARTKGVRLVNEVPEIVAVFCDRDRVLRVFSNLVGNAIKFTPEGGTVALRASGDGAAVRVAVADTGPGIAPEELPKIFNRYWQARHQKKGVGLGLAIARGIVEAHGGRIWAESEPGRGTTIYFTLPARNPAAE